MTKILIPRSDSISAKIIEPSDFEELFGAIVQNYVSSGFALSAGSGLTVNVAVGKGRLSGLLIENSASETVSSLTASSTNYIYVTLARDSNSEAEAWDFSKNTTGTTPTDSLFIGTATTDGSSVTAVSTTNVENVAQMEYDPFGDGSDGDATIATNTDLGASNIKYYDNLTVNSGVTLSGNSPLIIFAKTSVTVTGGISVDNAGGGGTTVAGGVGGASSGSYGTTGADGNTSNAGTAGYFSNGHAGGNGGDGGGRDSDPGGGGKSDGGTAGSAVAAVVDTNIIQKSLINILSKPHLFGTGGNSGASGGGGGGANNGGGIGGTGGTGGAGGHGGGSLIIVSPTITMTGTLSANATNGANGGDGVDAQTAAGGKGAGGGGGAGGNGGYIFLGYFTKTETGTMTVTAGTAGSGGAISTVGYDPSNVSGNDATAGVAGAAGTAGQIVKINVKK